MKAVSRRARQHRPLQRPGEKGMKISVIPRPPENPKNTVSSMEEKQVLIVLNFDMNNSALILSVSNLILSVSNLILSVSNLILSVSNLILSVSNLILSVSKDRLLLCPFRFSLQLHGFPALLGRPG
jgi:hypothetical protein